MTDGDGPLRALVNSADVDVEYLPSEVRKRLSDALLGFNAAWTDRYVPDDSGLIILSELTVTNNGTGTIATDSVSGAGIVFESLEAAKKRTITDGTVTPTDGGVTIAASTSSDGGFSTIEATRPVKPGRTLTLELLGPRIDTPVSRGHGGKYGTAGQSLIGSLRSWAASAVLSLGPPTGEPVTAASPDRWQPHTGARLSVTTQLGRG